MCARVGEDKVRVGSRVCAGAGAGVWLGMELVVQWGTYLRIWWGMGMVKHAIPMAMDTTCVPMYKERVSDNKQVGGKVRILELPASKHNIPEQI